MNKELDIKAPDGNTYTIRVDESVSDNDAIAQFAQHYQQQMEQGGLPKEPVGVDTASNKFNRFAREYARQVGMLGKNVAEGGIGAVTGIPELGMRGYNLAAGKLGLSQIPEEYMPSSVMEKAIGSPELQPQSGLERTVGALTQAAAGAGTGVGLARNMMQSGIPAVQKAGQFLGGNQTFKQQAVPMMAGTLGAEAAKESGHPELAIPASIIGSLTPAGVKMMTGGVASNVAQRVASSQSDLAKALSQESAYDRLYQILKRDAEANHPDVDPIEYAKGRLEQLGGRAGLAAVGPNTLAESDLLASLSGPAKGMFKQEAERISGTRGPTLQAAAGQALNEGAGLPSYVSDLIATRKAAADPLYKQVNNTQVTVDKELQDLLKRSESAHGLAETTAKVAGRPIDLSKLTPEQTQTVTSQDALMNQVQNVITKPGSKVLFGDLDKVKQSLYDAATAAKKGGHTNLGNEYDNLRRQLTDKLDRLSPTDAQGNSIYKTAREAYAGPSQLKDAAEVGSNALTMKLPDLKEAVNQMTQGELDAFRVGAAQAYKQAAGSQSGMTAMMKFLKEPNTRDRMQLVFGDKADDFMRSLLRESDVKQMERIGQGSQTMPRSALAEDQGVSVDAVKAAASLAHPSAAVATLLKGSKFLTMPEATRTKLAELLLARGGSAEDVINDLQTYMANKATSAAQQKRLASILASRAAAQAGQEQ